MDPLNQQLWWGSRLVSLPPKTFAVLRYLVERPQRLITKRELLDALWRDVHVGEAVLKTHLKEIRQALGDSVKTPRFIETVHRRGYRFVAPIEQDPPAPKPVSTPPLRSLLVGRQEPLSRLAELLDTARGGQRGTLFVSGEPGIGKTALVDAFFGPRAERGDVWLARGQCIEQYGAGATFLPILEALGGLCRGPDAARIVEVLRRHGPTWLVQLPELLDDAGRVALERTSGVATPERALRELSEVVGVLTQLRPLIWLLEDLQWADYSTLDAVSYLARRNDTARLLIVGTYRSVEIRLAEHPLRAIVQSLSLHEQCQQLELRHLTEGDVAEYLAARFPGHAFPLELAEMIVRRTTGNPLFIERVVDDWIKQRQLSRATGTWSLSVPLDVVSQSVPASILAMIERETERLSEVEGKVLEVASVVGNEFTTSAVAAALGEDIVGVDELCSRWARHGRFLAQGRVERENATTSYQFIHALYHQVIYHGIGQARRARLHQSIGEHAEALQGDQPQGAALASHFERAHDVPRALRYRRVAGDQALGRSAYRQAVNHFRAAIELCRRVPAPESQRIELELQVALGVPLAMTLGYAAPEVETCYVRATALSRELGGTAQSFPVMSGLATFYLMRGRYLESARIGEAFLGLATRDQDTGAELEANIVLGTCWLFMGDFERSVSYFERALVLYDPLRHRAHRFVYQQDAYVQAQTFLAWAQWILGYPDQALGRVQAALQVARQVAEPHNVAIALFNVGHIHQWRGEVDAAKRCADALLELCAEHGFSFLLAAGTELSGAALVQQGEVGRGLGLLRAGWAGHQATGAEMGGTYWRAVLADACLRAGAFDEAGQVLVEALAVADERSERGWKPELYRLHGELCQVAPGRASRLPDLGDGSADPRRSFDHAIALARELRATSLELRAATSLGQLLLRQGKRAEARALLADVCQRIDEGSDTPDQRDARALIAEYSRAV